MPKVLGIITLLCVLWLANETQAMVCFMGQEPDPSSNNKYRWVIPVRDPCGCTEVRMGALNPSPPGRSFRPKYLDTFLLNADDIRMQLNCSCSFVTLPHSPYRFTFILTPLTMPFRLIFEVMSERDPFLALADNKTEESIFAEITIGGWVNKKSAIRACYSETCRALFDGAVHNEAGIVSNEESRPFWVEYSEGVVSVGKGGQEEAFMEWDAGAYHGRVPTRVHVGIASWLVAPAHWVFYQFCG